VVSNHCSGGGILVTDRNNTKFSDMCSDSITDHFSSRIFILKLEAVLKTSD